MHSYKTLSIYFRILPVAGLLVTTALSVALLENNLSQRISTGNLYVWVKDNHIAANVLINVLAQLLAFIQIFALCSITNYSTRSSLSTKSVSLDVLKFWNAISLGRVDWSLSFGTLSFTLAFSTFMLLPSIGWVAAITPSLTTTNITTVMSVPVYTPDPYGSYWNRSWHAFQRAELTLKGNDFYSYIPGATAAATLMSSAATASCNGSDLRNHRKSDGSVYNYVGRSYGLGASVGLANLTSHTLSPYSKYAYNETGYSTSVSCTYNQTSNWTLEAAEFNNGTLPDLFIAKGRLAPGNAVEHYAVFSFIGNNSIVALIAGGRENTNNIAIAAGSDYAELNKIQCATEFTPTNFRIAVDRGGRNITVTPLSPGVDVDPTSASQPDHRGRLQQAVLWELTRLSQRNVNLYSSTLGESLKSNIARRAGVANSSTASDSQRLAAVAESFEAVIDDILLAISSAQYMLGPEGSRRDVNANMVVAALVVGTRRGIFSVLVANALFMLGCLIECARTRLWSRAPAWDYRNLTDVVGGASRGGMALATAIERCEGHGAKGGKSEESLLGWQDVEQEPKVRLVALARGSEALVWDADNHGSCKGRSSRIRDGEADFRT